MPARIVLVESDAEFVEQASTALEANGYSVAAYLESLRAIEALDHARQVQVLVTEVLFPPGQPNGLSLALMAIHKKPGVRVIFMGPPELQHHTTGVGKFLPAPVSVPQLLSEVRRISKVCS